MQKRNKTSFEKTKLYTNIYKSNTLAILINNLLAHFSVMHFCQINFLPLFAKKINVSFHGLNTYKK